jgi:predicted ATPase
LIPLINQVHIRNYKSIGQAVVTLEPFTALVGPNGAGKSNFVDALSFVQECLSESIELAFKNRGGISAVRRRSGGHPTHIGIRIVMNLEEIALADYAFEIAAEQKEKFRVARERCVVKHHEGPIHIFEIRNGKFAKEIPGIRPKVSSDRLALFVASATEEFRPVYDFLTSMRFYSISPNHLRELQDPDPGDFLKREGSNAAAVLKRLKDDAYGSEQYERICRLLSKIVTGVRRVEYQAVGTKETLKFKQDVGLKCPWTFDALNMSDGTLRVLGLLLAIYQPNRPNVVAVEEPEATIHPAAAEIVIQVLLDAAKEKQILITTHSPDILDYKHLTDDQIRVVTMERGGTLISPISASGREAIREHLYTAGELLRVEELNPDLAATNEAIGQLNLFVRIEGMDTPG